MNEITFVEPNHLIVGLTWKLFHMAILSCNSGFKFWSLFGYSLTPRLWGQVQLARLANEMSLTSFVLFLSPGKEGRKSKGKSKDLRPDWILHHVLQMSLLLKGLKFQQH